MPTECEPAQFWAQDACLSHRVGVSGTGFERVAQAKRYVEGKSVYNTTTRL